MTFLPLPYSSLLTVCESLRVLRTEFTLFFPFFSSGSALPSPARALFLPGAACGPRTFQSNRLPRIDWRERGQRAHARGRITCCPFVERKTSIGVPPTTTP